MDATLDHNIERRTATRISHKWTQIGTRRPRLPPADKMSLSGRGDGLLRMLGLGGGGRL